MATVIRDEPDIIVANPTIVSKARRISWGAIFAGVLIAIIIQVTMNVLGLAVGSAVVDPTEASNPIGPVFSTGAVIWIASSTLIGIFAGGFVSAHLAGVPDELDAVLHGLLTWALGTVLIFFMLSTTASSVLSGVSTLVAEGIGLIGANVEEVAPEVLEAFDVRDTLIASIEEEVGEVDGVNSTNTELILAVATLAQMDAESENINESRQVAIDLLVEQTELTPAEARSTVDDWEEQYRRAIANADEVAEEAAANFADALAATSGILFLTLIVGAFAGGAGGFVGRPDEVVV